MNTDQVKLKRQEIINQFGEWTSHNIHLENNTYTYDENHPKFKDQLIGHGTHLQRIIQAAVDITNKPLDSLRVLDLACLEGLYGIEFAQHGSEVIAIEGREVSVEKARFTADILKLQKIKILQDDVRNLSLEDHGSFDVVLCLGILYHLDAPDVFHFVEKIAEVCERVAVIDTQIALNPNKTHIFKGAEYHGWTYTEHDHNSSEEEKLKNLWSSLDNENSFWLTAPSLYNLLSEAGFTSVYTCRTPAVPNEYRDRETIIAIKGNRQKLFSIPEMNSLSKQLVPEEGRAETSLDMKPKAESKLRQTLRRGLNLARRIFR